MAEPGEIRPAVVLEGEQSSMDELKHKPGVSVDVKAVARPGVYGKDHGGDFCYIVRQGHTSETH